MTTEYFYFEIKPELTTEYLQSLDTVLNPVLKQYSEYNYTAIWQLLDKPNSFIHSTRWSDNFKRAEFLKVPTIEKYANEGTKVLTSPMRSEKYSSFFVYDKPFKIEEIEFEKKLKELRRRSVYISIIPEKNDLFIRLCKEHSKKLVDYGNRVKTFLEKSNDVDYRYCINNIWQDPVEEMNYFNSNDFKMFWNVMNSLLERSPVTMYSKRIYSSKNND